MYYHRDARAMQLGSDIDHACGSQHLSNGHIQRIVGKVYEKSRQNITVIFDIPRNAEDADVTRVYEDLKSMVYDDAHRRRAGRHHFEQPLPGGRLPAGQGAVRNTLGGRRRGVRGERVRRQARGRRLGDDGHGNGPEGAGLGEPLAPVEAGSGVQRPAREGRSTCRRIDVDDLGRGCRWPQHDPPLELATEAFIL